MSRTYLLPCIFKKTGRLQLELLEKKTGASRLNMKVKLIQTALNRNEKSDPVAIENVMRKINKVLCGN